MQKSIRQLTGKSKIIIVVPSVILIIGLMAWFYWDYKETQKSVIKVEEKFAKDGMDKFYQKQGNRFCVKNAPSEEEQEAIARDMLWVLEEGDYREVKEIECDEGRGIEIK